MKKDRSNIGKFNEPAACSPMSNLSKRGNEDYKSNIVLIGMPGAGKSTVGVLLAKSLGMSFIDTDLVIQTRENGLLQEILDRKGIEAFLRIEEEAVLSLNVSNCVIATGGSVVYSSRAMEHLGWGGYIVYLKLAYEEMESRLKNIRTRGIVLPPGKTLLDLYMERVPLYERYSQVTVESTRSGPEDTVAGIIQAIENLRPNGLKTEWQKR